MKYCEAKRAFTLIELLVVIAIIVILAGILMIAVSKVMAASKTAATYHLIRQLDTACRNYYNDWHKYPPDGNGDAEKAINSLYLALTSKVSVSGAPAWGPYMEVSSKNLVTKNGRKLIVDFWSCSTSSSKGHLIYDNNLDDTYDASDGYVVLDFDGANDANPFDIISAGRDGDYETPPDNVNNWED